MSDEPTNTPVDNDEPTNAPVDNEETTSTPSGNEEGTITSEEELLNFLRENSAITFTHNESLGTVNAYSRNYYENGSRDSINLDEKSMGIPFPYTEEQAHEVVQERIDGVAKESNVVSDEYEASGEGGYMVGADENGGLRGDEEEIVPDGMDDSLAQKWWLSNMASAAPYYDYVKNLYKKENELAFNNINYQDELRKYAHLMSANVIVYNRNPEGVYNGRQGLGGVYLDQRANLCYVPPTMENPTYIPCYPEREDSEEIPTCPSETLPILASAYLDAADELCVLSANLINCISTSAANYLHNHSFYEVNENGDEITGRDVYMKDGKWDPAAIRAWACETQEKMESIISACADETVMSANEIMQTMAEISFMQTVISNQPTPGGGGGGGGGGGEDPGGGEAEPLPMGNKNPACIIKIDWWLWLMAILIIILNTALIIIAVRIFEDMKDKAAAAIHAAAAPDVYSICAALKAAAAIWFVIGFVLFLVTWFYCALMSLCVIKKIPHTPLATFPDPSVLLNKLMTLGGLRLRLPQPPNVNMGPLSVITNWVEDYVMEQATEWGNYAADAILGLSEGEAENIMADEMFGDPKKIDKEAVNNDPDKKEIPYPFMEAIARKDTESIDGELRSRENIMDTFEKILTDERVRTAIIESKKAEGLSGRDDGEYDPTQDEIDAKKEEILRCADSVFADYVSDENLKPDIGLPRWCGGGDKPLVATASFKKDRVCNKFVDLETIARSWIID